MLVPNLGYFGTENGDMINTREVIHENVRVACDLIKSHPLTLEPSVELFAQKGISAFWFLVALIATQNGCGVIWRVSRKSGYKLMETYGTYCGQLRTHIPSQL